MTVELRHSPPHPPTLTWNVCRFFLHMSCLAYWLLPAFDVFILDLQFLVLFSCTRDQSTSWQQVLLHTHLCFLSFHTGRACWQESADCSIFISSKATLTGNAGLLIEDYFVDVRGFTTGFREEEKSCVGIHVNNSTARLYSSLQKMSEHIQKVAWTTAGLWLSFFSWRVVIYCHTQTHVTFSINFAQAKWMADNANVGVHFYCCSSISLIVCFHCLSQVMFAFY